MAAVSTSRMEKWLSVILKADPTVPKLSLGEYLADIPKLDSLSDLPAGTRVLVRGDVDAKPGPKIGEGDIRLRSMKDTLEFGRQRGWIQVIFGHIGRKPEGSLDKVAARIGEILGCEVPLIKDWLNPETNTVLPEAADQISKAAPGSVIVLENTRKYPIERVLWEAKAEDIPKLASSLATLANEMAEKIARVYVHEAFSAGSLDSSSVVVPAAMDRVAMGKYEEQEFCGPLMQCLEAQMVIFSGVKIDKLDDLEAMIARGKIRYLLTAGSLAMALKKAAAQLEGGDFCIGVQQNPANSKEAWYIPPERIEQAGRLLREGRAKGIQFVLPVDFVLQDGRIAETIGPNDQQLDVGPKTRSLFQETVSKFIQENSQAPEKAVVFHNGVFGLFEDSRFEEGTRHFMGQLKRMKDAGLRVFVGGGEGGTALEKYGQPDWVTHNFTAGGTVLNALGAEPVPYLVALRMAAKGW
jgi:phosphoglycerate kinase